MGASAAPAGDHGPRGHRRHDVVACAARGIGYTREYDLQFHTRGGKEAALRLGELREAIGRVADAALA